MTAKYKLACGCTVTDELAAFDALPPNIREAVSSSPFGTCATEVARDIANWGADNWLIELRRAERALAA